MPAASCGRPDRRPDSPEDQPGRGVFVHGQIGRRRAQRRHVDVRAVVLRVDRPASPSPRSVKAVATVGLTLPGGVRMSVFPKSLTAITSRSTGRAGVEVRIAVIGQRPQRRIQVRDRPAEHALLVSPGIERLLAVHTGQHVLGRDERQSAGRPQLPARRAAHQRHLQRDVRRPRQVVQVGEHDPGKGQSGRRVLVQGPVRRARSSGADTLRTGASFFGTDRQRTGFPRRPAPWPRRVTFPAGVSTSVFPKSLTEITSRSARVSVLKLASG